MKKQMFILGLLLSSASLFGNAEDKVFVQPFVSKIGQGAKAKVMALNVGTNIPGGLIVSKEGKREGLNSYMADLAKKLEMGQAAVVTAPASYDIVFSDGTVNDDAIHKQMDEVLAKVGISKDKDTIIKALSELKGVNRATFVQREDSLVLVTDKRALKLGETIFRKTAEGVFQDIYHSEEEYLVAFNNAGLFCEEISRPSFFGQIKWKAYNDSHKNEKLGAAYIEHNPVTIYHVVKKAA